jgi:hypothetical protein
VKRGAFRRRSAAEVRERKAARLESAVRRGSVALAELNALAAAEPARSLAPVRRRHRRSGRKRDPEFLALVHRLPCCARLVAGHRCEGPIEADHAGERPLGRKADDDTTIPLCMLGHRERTDFSGPFRSWDRAAMRAWLDASIEATRTSVALMRAAAAPRGQT